MCCEVVKLRPECPMLNVPYCDWHTKKVPVSSLLLSGQLQQLERSKRTIDLCNMPRSCCNEELLENKNSLNMVVLGSLL